MNKFRTAIAFVFLLVPAVHAQHTITTVAGGVPNNINARSVGFQVGTGIAKDSSGNLYIADSFNSAIYKVSSSGIVSTVVGIGGAGGFSADGSPAIGAQLNFPEGVFVDTAGNIFVADTGNSRIREVVASTGKIQTVAGNGTSGFSGDGGPATSAELSAIGVFVDTAGNIFIADTFNNRIREVVASTGRIQTVAGSGATGLLHGGFSGDSGPATSAELNGPVGIFVDRADDIFIADTGNNRIREVVASTGKIQTVAGNGTNGFSGDGGPATSAELNGPTGVFVDSVGNIFFADTFNNRIREVVASTGEIQTVAGNGTNGFSGDGDLATSAELNGPTGVFVDSAGNISVADSGNNRIREVANSSGIIQTFAGNGTVDFSGDGVPAKNAEVDLPSGVFVDGGGNIFIADTDNQRIREVVASTGKIQTVAGSGSNGLLDGGPATLAVLNFPSGVFVDGGGNIFIADTGDQRIREVVASTGEIQTVAGNGNSGSSGDGGPATSAELNGSTGVFVDTVGNIFIADFFNERIREVIASTGKIQTVAGNGTSGLSGDGGPATSAELAGPQAVFVDSAGNIFIADVGNQRIREVVASTGTIQTVVGNGSSGFSGDGGPAVNASLDRPIYALCETGTLVGRISTPRRTRLPGLAITLARNESKD